MAVGLLAIGLALLPVGASAQSATPEDAVSAYVAAIAAGDVDGILAASAVDEMASGFDFQAYAERVQALIPVTSLAPADYPMYAAMDRYQQAALLLGQVRNLAYGLLSDEDIDGSVIAPVDAARIAAFAAAVDPSQLAGLSVVDDRFPVPDMATNERYLANAQAQAAIYGADELTERLTLVDLDGQTYALGLTLLRYGDRWLVASQSSPIAGTSSLGTAEPMTREEFDAQTGG
jgi:hypothetical protein